MGHCRFLAGAVWAAQWQPSSCGGNRFANCGEKDVRRTDADQQPRFALAPLIILWQVLANWKAEWRVLRFSLLWRFRLCATPAPPGQLGQFHEAKSGERPCRPHTLAMDFRHQWLGHSRCRREIYLCQPGLRADDREHNNREAMLGKSWREISASRDVATG